MCNLRVPRRLSFGEVHVVMVEVTKNRRKFTKLERQKVARDWAPMPCIAGESLKVIHSLSCLLHTVICCYSTAISYALGLRKYAIYTLTEVI